VFLRSLRVNNSRAISVKSVHPTLHNYRASAATSLSSEHRVRIKSLLSATRDRTIPNNTASLVHDDGAGLDRLTLWSYAVHVVIVPQIDDSWVANEVNAWRSRTVMV
jgi:hypothetical protein